MVKFLVSFEIEPDAEYFDQVTPENLARSTEMRLQQDTSYLNYLIQWGTAESIKVEVVGE